MTVQRILNMQRKAATHITPDVTIAQVLQSHEFEETGALVVSSNGTSIAGIITERDIARGLKQLGSDLLGKPVRELMTVKVITCEPDDRAAGIVALMVSKHVRHLPVVKDGRFFGMVSVLDLLRLRLEEVRSEAEAMQRYIAGNT